MIIVNAIKHFGTITRHKWMVFKYCCIAGIPWRGFMHDWSKFSWTEFSESVKYYQGTRSPIPIARIEKGYSEAWLHHKGRNKHHYQYWYDDAAKEKTLIMPYKYAVEMICDNLAAGKVYNKNNWTKSTQLEYWQNVESQREINPKMYEFGRRVFEEVSINGINKTIKKKNLKKIYNECVNTK